jgi:hypothetical protein
MSVPTRHVATDALGALRGELVSAARRRAARRRARTRVLAAAAAAVMLLAIAAAAGALSNFSTGVPTVDKLLQIESGVDAPPGEAGRDLRPGPGAASEPLKVPVMDRTGHAVAYLSRDGRICHATAQRHPRIEGSVRGSFGGCYEPADLARQLELRTILWGGSSLGPDHRVFSGYAAADVEEIRVVGEDHPMRVGLSPPWTPAAPGAEPLRHFVVVDETDIDVGGDGVQMNEIDLISRRAPRLQVRLTGGDVREILPP